LGPRCVPLVPLPPQHVNKGRSSPDEINERLSKLEHDFSAFDDFRADFDSMKTTIDLLTNDKNTMHEEMKELKGEMEELQTDLNEIVKDQDMLKIIQLEHENKISQLVTSKKKSTPVETPFQEVNHYEESLKTIQNKQEQFDNSLRTITESVEAFQKIVAAANNGITELNGKMTGHQQQLEKTLHDHDNALQKQIIKLQEELKKTIPEVMNQVRAEVKALADRLDSLEEVINGVQLPAEKTKDPLPYVEKLAAVDLLEISWTKYRQGNIADING
jgi:chromosome segregation ATPase